MYGIGVDLGTTFTAAAVRRADSHVEMITLGRGGFAVPSVVYALPEGGFLVGDVAMDRGRPDPGRLAVEFKRRLGDSAPILLGGAAYSADRLTAELLRWTLGVVAERQGASAHTVVVTHPANWGDFRRDMLRAALSQAGVSDATIITEPEAAAVHYATRERVEPGELVAVYDLGGGTFDAVVLERTETGFVTRGRPRGIERLGGVDLDHIVRGMVLEHLTTDLSTLDVSDPSVAADLFDLQAQCIQAKVALSSDLATTVRVRLASERADIRLTRAEFEQRASPTLQPSIEALEATIRGADIAPSEIAKILLVGGSSRVPLIAEMVFEALGRPVAVDTDPKAAVAMGAAHVAAPDDRGLLAPPAPVQVPSTGAAETAVPAGAADPSVQDRSETAPPPPSAPPPLPPPPSAPPPPPAEAPAPPEAPPPDDESPSDDETPPPPPVAAVDEVAAPPPPVYPESVQPSEQYERSGPTGTSRRRALSVVAALLVLAVIVTVVIVVTRDGDPPDEDDVVVGDPDDDGTDDRPEDGPVEFVDLEIVGETVFPFDTEIRGQQFTSISGIAFDPNAGVHLGVRANTNRPDPELIAPEPVLFTFRVTASGDVQLVDGVTLTGPDGQPYGLELDAEGLEVLDDGTIVVVSEGQPADDGDLFVHRHDRDGSFLQAFTIPETYQPTAVGDRGVLHGGFDAVTLVRDTGVLIAGLEYPLAQDDTVDPQDDKIARLLGFDAESGEAVREWAYPLDTINDQHPDPGSVRGAIVALAAVDDRTLLVWERSFALPGTEPTFVLYQADLTEGVEPAEGLPPVLDKSLVWVDDTRELTGNYDSVSLGQPSVAGDTTLVFAGDCRYRECETSILTVALSRRE